ncbi:GrpB domain protein [Poronia punctata]|nr:GrpB domain protein [Poronia punctata]
MATASDITTLLEDNLADVEIIARRPQKPLEIVDYNPEWPSMFAEVEKRIRDALGDRAVVIQHVGSTSVPGLSAKDIIDVDLAVPDPTDEDSYVPALQAAGFKFLLREPKWHQHRLFYIESPYTNLHVFGPDSSEMVRHRMFRDWMREHPGDRELYVAAKKKAVEATNAVGGITQQYTDHKEPVIWEILGRIFEAHGLLNSSSAAA